MTTIFTIGHSTHPIEEFIGLLKSHDIERLVDVRTIPKSRHNPQFSQDALAASVKAQSIAYSYMKGLGGLRHAKKDSPNRGWRNDSFRGYADYMQTKEFEVNLEELISLSAKSRTVIMCAESVPWRCHRSLIGDALVTRKIEVMNIMPEGKLAPHKLNPMAHVEGKCITYPQETLELPYK